MTRWADRFFVQQQLREMNFDKPAFVQCPTLLGAQPESPECKQFDSAQEDVEEEAVPQVHWMLSLMLVWMRRRKPLGARPRCHLPCKGSIPGRVENFKGLKISALVSHCFKKLPKRMPFPIGIGIERSKMPWSEATMLPRLKK